MADGYGGGFIEFMMTGHAGEARAARTYAPPPAYQAPIHAAPVIAPSGAGLPDYAPAPPAYYPGASRHQTSYDPIAADPGLATRPIDPIYQRQEVAYAGREHPGTIVIDTPRKFLFLVESGGHALRYGIGVGRPGFAWAGLKTITRKAEWPDWTPPPEMLLRRPDLPRHMEGGPANPLGARALYLGSSLYRIHGTNEPYTIGTNVSSGCIRMMNTDVIDLYGRVGVGTPVIVM
jgi:lipoprotein-anchoring transpeptidase ErfK/SrfK